MKVLITGMGGFVGYHFAEFCAAQDCTTFGTYSGKKQQAIVGSPPHPVQTAECDIRDPLAVRELIRRIRPDYIFHCAAKTVSQTGDSSAGAALDANVVGTVNLLEAVCAEKCDPVILVPGSSAQFGLVENTDIPVREECRYRPLSHYGVTKIAQAFTAYRYHLVHGLKTIRTHTFNCVGPRQSDDFVCSAIARQIAEIEAGLRPPVIQMGNLDSYRDFVDVRDAVKAYWLLAAKGVPGDVYNVCSGHAISIAEVLGIMLGLAKVDVAVRYTSAQRSDVSFQRGDFAKLKELTGWEPAIPIEVSLEDTLNHWRAAIPKAQLREMAACS